MTRHLAPRLFAIAFLAAASYPVMRKIHDARDVRQRLDRLSADSSFTSIEREDTVADEAASSCGFAPDPALVVRVADWGPLLAGWQTVAGCGAGSATGSGAGVKWIGRGVRGGLFNVQCQTAYTRFVSAGKQEQQTFVNTLITREITEKWIVGANLPFVYKYVTDYYFADAFGGGPGTDVSNGGLGDMSLQVSRRLGPINATTVTGILGLPTGTWDAKYKMMPLHQHQQLGFGKLTGSVVVDHTMDEIWGVIVVGGLAGWRGGQNQLDSYRAPNATTYAYTGYFLGSVVPAVGVALTGFASHDRDQTLQEGTGLFSAAGNVSVEWSTDYLALLLGASFPYQYDGITKDANGAPKSPWGRGAWMVAFGFALAPF